MALEVHHCIHCGTESQPSWRFCRRCGTALENLAEAAKVASCSNCASPIAEGWRFCANCGTGTEAAEDEARLTEDDVADLIGSQPSGSAPATPDQAPATSTSTEPPGTAPHATQETRATSAAEPTTSPVESAPVRSADTVATSRVTFDDGTAAASQLADRQPATAPSSEIEPGEPAVETQRVSFDAAAELGGVVDETAPPRAVTDMPASPPPPPPDPSLPSNRDIAAAKAQAEAPPAAPPRPAGEEPHDTTPAVVEPAADPFAARAVSAPASDIGEESVASAAPGSTEPAVIIPRSDEQAPQIRSGIPRPLSTEPVETVPRPVELERDTEPETAVPADVRPLPAEIEEPDAAAAEELPPLEGRFRNPGLAGQGLQVALIVTAFLSVAMMVSLIVLNNRLNEFATTGESQFGVESAERIVNTRTRPLLILALLITYALLVMWSRRVLDNLDAFNNYVEETPIWMWLMPIVNLWVLFRHFDLTWKGSDHYARGASTWRRGRPDPWTVGFVLLPVIALVLILYGWVLGADTFESAMDANAFSFIGYAVLAMGLLAGGRAVGNIVTRQRSRAESMG